MSPSTKCMDRTSVAHLIPLLYEPTMSPTVHVTGKATLKILGQEKTYIFSRREIDDDRLGELTLRNIMRDLGADGGDPALTEVRLMNSEDDRQVLHVTGEEILIMAGGCITSGEWTTGLGPVATATHASPAAKEGAASGVSKTSRGREYSSHWKVCLRRCSSMRALLVTLPAAAGSGVPWPSWPTAGWTACSSSRSM